MPSGKPIRLAYVVSHPIQYQAPLLRRIAQESGIDLTVFFASDFSLRTYQDKGFGVLLTWDVPLVEGYQHEFLPKLWGRGIHTISRGLLRRLRDFDVLWIHGYNSPNALQAMFAAKALGIPVLLRAESWLGDRERSLSRLAIKSLALKFIAWLVAAVLPIGTRNAAYWTHYFGSEMPQFLMPYAVDNAYFQARTQAAAGHREALRQELRLDAERPVILFASKLQNRKRCADLIAAYASLLQAGLKPVPYLLVVGDGEELAALQAQSSALEGVRFCGFRNQSELPRFFDLATLFVLPACHEPWGLIVNEVMNAGLPIIVSDAIGCQTDLIHDGIEGYVYPAGDIRALKEAIRRVLCDSNHTQAVGQRALQRVNRWSFEEDVSGLRKALAYVTSK